MTQLRDMLKDLLESEWSLDDGAQFVAGRSPKPLDGQHPLVRVYGLNSPAEPKGAGYDTRKVEHHLTVDVRSHSPDAADNAKDEALRILGANRDHPWDGYDLIDFDDGSDQNGGPNLGVWTIEVTIFQMRKPIAT